jgi:hypothetical protein
MTNIVLCAALQVDGTQPRSLNCGGQSCGPWMLFEPMCGLHYARTHLGSLMIVLVICLPQLRDECVIVFPLSSPATTTSGNKMEPTFQLGVLGLSAAIQ